MSSKFIKVAYLFFFCWYCVSGILSPLANYDMLPYVGTALDYRNHKEDLLDQALADVKSYVSKEKFKPFTEGNVYVETVGNNNQAFVQQLPNYRIKPLYILLTGLLGVLFGNFAFASVVVASFGFVLSGMALYLLRPKGIAEPYYLTSIIVFSYLANPAFTLFASASTPDSLAIGLTLFGIWALRHKPNTYLSAIFFALSVLARPDSIATIACLTPLVAMIYLQKNDAITNYRQAAASLSLPLLAYLISKLVFPSFSLKELIVFAIDGPFPYVTNIDTSLFWDTYKRALAFDIASLLLLPRFTILIVLNIILLFIPIKNFAKYILLAAIANIVTKIILFPNFDNGYGERFFFVSYFFIIWALFDILNTRLSHNPPGQSVQTNA